MLGEVALDHLDLTMGMAEAAVWTLPAARGKGLTTMALSAVLRFAFGGLDLQRITYAWAEGNPASGRVAQKCGFVDEGRLRSAWVVDGVRRDVFIMSRLPTDR